MTMLWLQMTPSPADQLTSMNSLIVQYIQVLLVLAGVLVLAWVTLRVGLPRMLGIRSSVGGPIQVLARYPLEPKKTLYLVKTFSQVFLIATSESQVEFLTAVALENAAEIIEPVRVEEPPRKDFRQILSWLQKGREG
jgi:flagellar biogenesis protein FliO